LTRIDPACIKELLALQREEPESGTPTPGSGQSRAA
jgi:hypothetical protein